MAYIKGVVSGRLTKEVELRKTANGTSVASFSVAVDRSTGKNQEKTTDFYNCIAWKGTADYINNYVHKGDMLTAEFRLQTRSYQNKAGQDVHVTELVIDSVIAVTPKRGTATQAAQPAQQYTPAQAQPVPAQPQQQYQGSYPEPDFSGEDFGL